jgi:hypothetical protein
MTNDRFLPFAFPAVASSAVRLLRDQSERRARLLASTAHEAKGHRSGRSPDWLKMKNPSAAEATREAEEDWSKKKWR